MKLLFNISSAVPARFSTPYRNITINKGNIATLDCVTEGDKPISINWFRDGSAFEASLHPKASIREESLDFGVRSRLTIKHTHRDDSSSFVCVATNQFGSDRMEFQLIVQEHPEPPTNLHLINFSSRSVNLSWEAPYDGNSIITSYIVQYKNMSGKFISHTHSALTTRILSIFLTKFF